jgi:glycosyltransferase involved in cell wall biosynthesis/GT2 family glycosyltransferase
MVNAEKWKLKQLNDTMKASIIINTYNRSELLMRTLESLRYLRYPEFEVVCVNGPSDDGTGPLLARMQRCLNLKCAICPEKNLAKSRNIGIQMAAGEIICFIDDDAVPEPNWLNTLATAFDDPKVAAAGGFIRDHTGVKYQARYVLCDRLGNNICFDKAEDISVDNKNADDHGNSYYVAITGTNSSFRKDTLVDLGGFDEAYAYFLDETDILIRLSDAGYKIVCIEKAEVHHKYAPSNQRDELNIPKTLYNPFRSKHYFALRHALPYMTLNSIEKNILVSMNEARAAQNWHLKQTLISKERHAALIDDIYKGYSDGLRMAFDVCAPYTRPVSFFSSPPAFQPFVGLLPANERIRLAFISQDYPPNPNGGIGVWTAELARSLAARGHEITVLTTAEEGPETVDFEEGVWVHRIKRKFFPERPYNAPEYLPQSIYDWSASAYLELCRVILLRGLDMVSAPIWDVEGIVAQFNADLPVYLSLHTSYGLVETYKPQWSTMREYMDSHVRPIIRAEKELLLKAPLIIANSKAIARNLSEYFRIDIEEHRLAIVPHGIKDINNDKLHGDILINDKLNILFVGRFEERKGIDTLLEVIPQLAERNPKICFTLIGKADISSYWDDFRNKYKFSPWFERIVSLGFVSTEELSEAYNNCDIFIAPSRYESFGLIYVEAMMWGKPCIGTISGGVPEVIKHNDNGILITPGSTDELRKALEILITDSNKRKSMGLRSREIYLQKFSNNIMAIKMEKAINKFIENFHKG